MVIPRGVRITYTYTPNPAVPVGASFHVSVKVLPLRAIVLPAFRTSTCVAPVGTFASVNCTVGDALHRLRAKRYWSTRPVFGTGYFTVKNRTSPNGKFEAFA